MTMKQIHQPFLNVSAFLGSLGMWLAIWGIIVLVVAYSGQPGVACLTPMAWLLALPAGWNYVAFAKGMHGRQPFIAGLLLGASLGLLYGLLFWAVSTVGMPAGSDPDELVKARNMNLIIVAAGTVIGALLSGFMARRAARLQQRGQAVPVLKVS